MTDVAGKMSHIEGHSMPEVSGMRDEFPPEKCRVVSLVSHVSLQIELGGKTTAHIPAHRYGLSDAANRPRCESVRRVRHGNPARPAQ